MIDISVFAVSSSTYSKSVEVMGKITIMVKLLLGDKFIATS